MYNNIAGRSVKTSAGRHPVYTCNVQKAHTTNIQIHEMKILWRQMLHSTYMCVHCVHIFVIFACVWLLPANVVHVHASQGAPA